MGRELDRSNGKSDRGYHADLARKLAELEKKYDTQFQVVIEAIRQLMEPPAEPPRGRFGFRPPDT